MRMHLFITISALILTLLTTGCEGQIGVEVKNEPRQGKLAAATEADDAECLKCLLDDNPYSIPCLSKCYVDKRHAYIHTGASDTKIAIPENLNRTVTSINGKPIRTKNVAEMAIGEQGWTAPYAYSEIGRAHV